MKKLLPILLLLLAACNAENDKIRSAVAYKFETELQKFEQLDELVVVKSDLLNLKQYCEIKLTGMEMRMNMLRATLEQDSLDYESALNAVKEDHNMRAYYTLHNRGSLDNFYDALRRDSLNLKQYQAVLYDVNASIRKHQREMDDLTALSLSKDTLQPYGYISLVHYKILSARQKPLSDTATFLISNEGNADRIDDRYW